MLFKQAGFKYLIAALFLTGVFLFASKENVFADPASIKGISKVYRNGSYTLLINYETRENRIDNLIFKVYCRFDKGDFTFTSSTLNDIARGWHRARIDIPDEMRKRYGSLRGYDVALYRNGMLVDTRTR